MPRIEFETELQQGRFSEWIGKRNLDLDAKWVDEFDLPSEKGEIPKVLAVWIISDEPLFVILEKQARNISGMRRLISAEVSKEHIKQLEPFGLIFDGEKLKPDFHPSQTEIREYAPGTNPSEW